MKLPQSVRSRVLALAVLGAFAYVAYRAWALFAIHGFIVSFAAVDGERAVVCMRANHEYGLSSRAWVGMLDARGRWVWSQRLDGLPIVGARSGLLVDEGHVIVRTEMTAGAPAKTSSYSLADGHLEWTRNFDEAAAAVYVDLVAAGSHVIQGLDKGPELVGLDAATGTITWRRTTGSILRGVRVAGPSLVWGEDLHAAIAPLVDGPVRKLESSGPGACIVGSDVIYVRGASVEAAPLDGKSAPRVVVAELPFSADVSGVIPIRCGLWQGHPVFTVSFADSKLQHRPALLEVDVAAGSQVGFDVLDADPSSSVVQDPIDASFPESAPLEGELAHFVPFVVRDGDKSALAVLDMETRKIVHRGASSEERLHTAIVADHGVFFVQTGGAGREKELSRFDGATGMITAAVRLPDVARLRPTAIAGGRIWVYREDWLDPLPWAILDAKTLAPVHVEGNLRVTPAAPTL